MGIFSDINEVELLGNVTDKPTVRYTQGGTAVATFNVATSRQFKQGDEWKTEADFTPVVLWAKLAEAASERVEKGTRVLIKGRIKTRSWEDDKKVKHYRTEVIARDMILIARYNKRDRAEDAPIDNPPSEATATQDDASVDPNDLPF